MSRTHVGQIILDLNFHEGKGGITTYSGLYVGLSRVRRGADVKLFPMLPNPHNINATSLHYLRTLSPSANLAKWLAGFDENGRWDVNMAGRPTLDAAQRMVVSNESKAIHKSMRESVARAAARAAEPQTLLESHSQPALTQRARSRRMVAAADPNIQRFYENHA